MEMIFQYMWKHKMFPRRPLTVDGEELEILSPGILNSDSGPDFSGARIRISGQEWAGNVEIHVKASDWFRHNHHLDPAYDSVILHVVSRSDQRVARRDGEKIPQLELPFSDHFARMYLKLSERVTAVPCESFLHAIPGILRTDWLSTLSLERLYQKADRIAETASSLGGDWEWACFVTLARALGFNLNGQPLEMLARSTPLKFILRHSDNLLQLEALLFGQAGFLDRGVLIFDEYYQLLCREYFFLARKYGLRPINADIWKYARTRPGNFPHRRIALLAAALHGGFSLRTKIVEARKDPSALRDLFRFEVSEYWQNHHNFDIESPRQPARLSKASVDLMLINFAAPLVAAVARRQGDPEMGEDAMSIWYGLPPERNTYISQWARAGIPAADAADSQALIQLRREYCDRMRCLDCRFCNALLRRSLMTPEEMGGALSPFDVPIEHEEPVMG